MVRQMTTLLSASDIARGMFRGRSHCSSLFGNEICTLSHMAYPKELRWSMDTSRQAMKLAEGVDMYVAAPIQRFGTPTKVIGSFAEEAICSTPKFPILPRMNDYFLLLQ